MTRAIDMPLRHKVALGLAILAERCPLPNTFTAQAVADASKVSLGDARVALRMAETRGAAGGLDVMFQLEADDPDLVWVDRFSS